MAARASTLCKTSDAIRAARTVFYFVTAGPDPTWPAGDEVLLRNGAKTPMLRRNKFRVTLALPQWMARP